ncbi:MAG: alpha/beta fold hydrolase [Rhodospirillales bacterium]|nr:alpha/beta fold hydrolase [Rhodospirillales bacterium]
MNAPDIHPLAPAMAEPLPELDGTAEHLATPCGDGRMVWRAWGSGPVLVLLHGGTGSWRHWARTIPAFAARHRVLAPDLPGLGESATPPEPHAPDGVGAIVAEGLSRLIGSETRYDLCGFSFGALAASQVAVRHGARLRSLTIVGAGAMGQVRAPVVLEKVRSRTGADRLAAHRVNLARFMMADPATVDDTAVAIQDWNTVHARLKSKNFAHTTALRDAVARCAAPVNAIWGTADVTAFPSLEARLAVLREARPDVTVRLIEGAGHWVAYEAAAAFNATLAELLARTPPA